MNRRLRRLRRLEPDQELLRRRAGGETLRSLARDYGVAHTSLGRYFRRPDVAARLRDERRARAARLAEERRLEGHVRAQAREQAKQRRAAARLHEAASLAPPARRRSAYELWLDERDTRVPLPASERHSQNDELGESIVAAGGGIEDLIDATGLRTRKNVLTAIDPEIVVRALTNDAAVARAAARAQPPRSRRLSPDRDLLRRRALGESLRSLADDYRVAHTTLGRYFARPEVAREIGALQQHPEQPERRPGREEHGTPDRDRRDGRIADEIVDIIRSTRCPQHGRAPEVLRRSNPNGGGTLDISCCCEQARRAVVLIVREEGRRRRHSLPGTSGLSKDIRRMKPKTSI